MFERDSQRGRWRQINAVALAVAVVGSAVLVNALASDVPWRVDLTADRLYTLGDISRQVAADLEDPVEVRVFISPDLPAPYHRLEQRVDELLAEYEAASRGRLNVEFVHPDGEADRQLARGYGIEPVMIGQQTGVGRSYREVYKGVTFVQGPHQEAVPDLQVSPRGEVANLEYEFTRALTRLKAPEPRRVGLVTGLGGPADRPGFVDRLSQSFVDRYGDLIELEAVDFADEPRIDEQLSAVVFVDIHGNLGTEGLDQLHRFVEAGGNVGWFQSGSVVDEQHWRGLLEYHRRTGLEHPPVPRRVRTETDLIDYFETIGIRFGADAVIDRQRALSRGPVPTLRGMIEVDHPGVFSVSNIDRQLPFTRHFSTLAVPMPSSITVEHGAVPDGSEIREVLRSEESAMRLATPPEHAFYDDVLEAGPDEQPGPHTLAVALEGGLAEADDELGRMLVVGTGQLVTEAPELGYTDELAAMGNEFFVGGVEWLAQRDELADIRGKQLPPMVTDVPHRAQRSIQFINIVLVPALFACIGLVMVVRRRRRTRQLVEEFRPEQEVAGR